MTETATAEGASPTATTKRRYNRTRSAEEQLAAIEAKRLELQARVALGKAAKINPTLGRVAHALKALRIASKKPTVDRRVRNACADAANILEEALTGQAVFE